MCSLAGVVLGIWIASAWQPQLTSYLRQYSGYFFLLPLISFAAIFVLVMVAANILGWALKVAFQKASMGWLDRSMGAAVALIKGLVVTYLFIILLTFCIPAKSGVIAGSKLTPWIVSSYQSIVGAISSDFYQRWKKKFQVGKDTGKEKKAGGAIQEKRDGR